MWVEFKKKSNGKPLFVRAEAINVVAETSYGETILSTDFTNEIPVDCTIEKAIDKLTSEVDKRLQQLEAEIREANRTPVRPNDLPSREECDEAARVFQTDYIHAEGRRRAQNITDAIVFEGNKAAAQNASDTVAAIAATEQVIGELAAQDGAGEVAGQTA